VHDKLIEVGHGADHGDDGEHACREPLAMGVRKVHVIGIVLNFNFHLLLGAAVDSE